MGKQLFEYKNKIISVGIQIANKDGLSLPGSEDLTSQKIRDKFEVTGNPEKDVETILNIIKELLEESKRSYL